LRPLPRTSFHHQPEAQHPKSSAIHKLAGRLPHLWVIRDRTIAGENPPMSAIARKRPNFAAQRNDAMCQQPTLHLWFEILKRQPTEAAYPPFDVLAWMV